MGVVFHGPQLLQKQEVDSVFPCNCEYLLCKMPEDFVPWLRELKNKVGIVPFSPKIFSMELWSLQREKKNKI